MPLCLGSLLSVHSAIALHCALVSVWPTCNRGALWGPERGHPGNLRLSSTEASVSQSAHNTTLLLLQLAALPSRSPKTACLSTRQGPTRLRSGWVRERCQYWLPIRLLFFAHYLCLALLSSRLLLPEQGALASWRESVVEYCKHMCVTYVWNGPGTVHILSPSGLTDKVHDTLHKMQRVVWLNREKQGLTFQTFKKWFVERVREVLYVLNKTNNLYWITSDCYICFI